MIVYFSGTGNSKYVAEQLATTLRENAYSLTGATPPTVSEERLGIVCPVYAWDVPEYVTQKLAPLLSNRHFSYIYLVLTCGENVGAAIGKFRRFLEKKGHALSAGFSIQMPNNYILFGDVCSPEETQRRIDAASERIAVIADRVSERHIGVDAVKGPLPQVMSYVISPLFNRFGRSTKPFVADDTCTACGLCVRLCPVKSIALDAERPTWGEACTQCLACLHRCPVQAIQYGKKTTDKGRYFLE